MATNLLQKLTVAIASTALTFAAIEASPAQALVWKFSFYNNDGRVGRVTFDDSNLTYSSLRFRKVFPVPTSGSYKIVRNLSSGDFSVKFDVGLRLKVMKQYSYWQLYNANGKLIAQSPRIGQNWGSCEYVTPDKTFPCATYKNQ
jgi:hypothetical protein